MLKHVAMSIALGLGVASAVWAQDADKNRGRDTGGYGDVNKDKDKDTGKRGGLFGEKGTKAEKLEEGVIKLSIEDVHRVKQGLIQRGYSFKDASGKWDHEMKDVVEKFQRDVGIKPTK